MRVSTRFRRLEIAATRVPPRARLTVPARDPRDRDPRPQALVVQQTALGGTSPRGGCASQSRDQRRRASLVAADAAGALFHERDFSRASPCVASVAPPPKSAPPLLRHTRWTETEVFAPTKCGKLRRRRGGGGDENRDPRGAAGGAAARPGGAATAPSAPASPRTAPALTGRMASSGPGTTAAAAAARTGAMAAAAAAATGTTRSTADRRRVRSRGREPDVGVARGVRRRAGWVGAARGRRRAGRAPEGRGGSRGGAGGGLGGGLREGSPGASSAALERLAAARAGACLASIASAHALRQQPKLSMSA